MSPITPRKAERLSKNIASIRKAAKKIKESNAAAIKARSQLVPSEISAGEIEATLMDSTFSEWDYRTTKFAELLADKTIPEAFIKILVQYYKLYRGYEQNVMSRQPFDPAVDYWQVLEAFHTKSFNIHNPSECIRFRRFYSLHIADSIPKKYENLFIDMFRFHDKYNPDWRKNVRAYLNM